MATQAIPAHGHGHATKSYPGLIEWLFTTDHKKIGIMYLGFTVFFFFIGGLLALLVRAQLAWSDTSFLTQDQYNQFFTMHASTMLFLFVIPVGAGFGNYFLLNAPFPRRWNGPPSMEISSAIEKEVAERIW